MYADLAAKASFVTTETDKTLGTLSAPTSVKVMPSLAGALSIKWTAVTDATHYVIQSSATPDNPESFTDLATVEVPLTTYRHTGLSFDQTLGYKVKACYGSDCSGWSETVKGTTHAKNYTYKIMPLGDSNTYGAAGSSTAPTDEITSYRAKLADLLRGQGTKFEYVGSEDTGSKLVYNSNNEANGDNAGFPGARNKDIVDVLEHSSWTEYWKRENETDYRTHNLIQKEDGSTYTGSYLDVYHPDIILLHIGTNNVGYTQQIDDLKRILDRIDSYAEENNKEVTVVLARIINRMYYINNGKDNKIDIDNTTAYNTAFNDLVAKRKAASDNIALVDMENGAGINYDYTDMADVLHLNSKGYAKMANVWFDVLSERLQPTWLPKPSPQNVWIAPSLAGALGIHWDIASSGVTEYVIESSETLDGEFKEIGRVAGTASSYRVTGLIDSYTSYYRVRSYDGEAYSNPSPVMEGTTLAKDYTYRIMPMGDSNTDGERNNLTDEGEKVAYRLELFRLLKKNGLSVNFVGGVKSGMSYALGGEKDAGIGFDVDHAGFGGITDNELAGQILTKSHWTRGWDNISFRITCEDIALYNIENNTQLNCSEDGNYYTGPYLDAFQPDIILLHVGTNSPSTDESSIEEILKLVDAYEQRVKKEVTVVVASTILGIKDDVPEIYEKIPTYNTNVRNLVDRRVSTLGDGLLKVDMENGAEIIYDYTDMADARHLNPSGYKKMAVEWYNGLAESLNVSTYPVELVSFNAKQVSNKVVLNWKTASEKDNSHFVVERSLGGRNFTAIGKVAGAGTSTQAHSYTFTDAAAPNGTVYYRLKQVDFDSTYTYSTVVAVQQQVTIKPVAVFPNPSDGEHLLLEATGYVPNEAASVAVLDVLGRQVETQISRVGASGNLSLDIHFKHKLPTGLYILTVSTPQKSEKSKFLVQNHI
ncbi:SGNH/GDSL hydrolase family protein [Pontibacter harenae]|uniref:SGNH/GDSL hydrolase family protein n=1 Tax=Pontibacter harenae TaxID=2894083 RepID=UPI001E554589|nr:SGNH/GDSL hydrolase family protein [Pontibacter harenae]MCC9166762.1 GDSL-type esterase/lipase family protein [Pontibacter harenae]